VVVTAGLVDQLNEKVERLRAIADELHSGQVLRSVVSSAHDPHTWQGGPQPAFAGWLGALDQFLRQQLADAVEAVADRVAARATQMTETAAAAAASVPGVPALAYPRPMGTVPPNPPDFHLGRVREAKANMNPDQMRSGLVRALGQAKDHTLELGRWLSDALTEPTPVPAAPGAGPIGVVRHLPPDALEAVGVPRAFTTIARQLDAAIQEVLDRADKWAKATAADTADGGRGAELVPAAAGAAAAARKVAAAAERLAADDSAPDARPGPRRRLSERERKAVILIREALDPTGAGIRRDDLIAIRKTLLALRPGERAAVIAKLTDSELRRWFEQMADGRIKGGVPRRERLQVLSMVAESVTQASLQRLIAGSQWIRDFLHPSVADTDAFKEGWLDSVGWTWAPVREPLFTQGPGEADAIDISDIHQGQLGDCYLLATLAAFSLRNDDAIRRLIHRNPNGTFTVTFYDDGGRPVPIVVTDEFPVDRSMMPVFQGDIDEKELWPMVIEKAYAQWRGGYAAIEGGWPDEVMAHLTGAFRTQRRRHSDVTLDEMRRWLAEGQPVCLCTRPDDEFLIGGDTYVANHAYAVVGIDGDDVLLRNPWGMQEGVIRMTPYDYGAFADSVETMEGP
jgi:calpain family cysteine protease